MSYVFLNCGNLCNLSSYRVLRVVSAWTGNTNILLMRHSYLRKLARQPCWCCWLRRTEVTSLGCHPPMIIRVYKKGNMCVQTCNWKAGNCNYNNTSQAVTETVFSLEMLRSRGNVINSYNLVSSNVWIIFKCCWLSTYEGKRVITQCSRVICCITL